LPSISTGCATKAQSGNMASKLDEFTEYGKTMHEKLLSKGYKTLSRIFKLKTNSYRAGTLGIKTKEIMGLVTTIASLTTSSIAMKSKSAPKCSWRYLQLPT